MNYSYSADMKYAKIVANKANLRLSIGDMGMTPCTDGSTIHLPPLNPVWPKDSLEYKDWWYALLHECFHNLHPEDFVMLKDKEINTQSFLGALLNLALDYKIETVNRGDFVGRDHIVHEARYAFAAAKIYGSFDKYDASKDPERLQAKLQATWVMDALCRIPWIPEYKRDDLPGMLSPEAQEWYVKLLQDSEVFDLYKNQKTSDDSYMVLCHLCAVLEIDIKDPEMNKAPDGSGGSGKGDGAEGKGEGKEGKGEGKQGDGEGKKGARGQEAWVDFSKMVSTDHSPDASQREAGLHINYDKLPPADWIPMPVEHVKGHYDETHLKDKHLLDKLDKQCAEVNMSKKIRRELQSMARTRFQGGKKRGKLRGRDVFKAVVQDTDKIFRKRIVKFNPKSTSAMVLTDFSGSMGGPKMESAIVATHELSRVMHAISVPHSVHSFSTQSRMRTKMFTFKAYGETFNSQEFLQECVSASHHMHCNADGDVLLWAGQQLLKRKTARKILFVLSDGSPAATDGHGNRGVMQWTQSVAKDLERMGIEVYAIGIEDRNVDKIYKHRATIKSSMELEETLLGVMRNKLIQAMV